MINSVCVASFFGNAKVHFLTVGSAFPIPELSDSSNDEFAWTGYEHVSMKDRLDLVYFFEKEDCLLDAEDPSSFIYPIHGQEWIPEVYCEPLGIYLCINSEAEPGYEIGTKI